MEDVTHLFDTYRECVRHLWNTYYRPIAEPGQDWDLRDEFVDVTREIFSSLVLRPLEIFEGRLTPEYAAVPAPLPNFQIAPVIDHGTPILINRDLPSSGYWDHPISKIKPNEVELHFLTYFDFDKLGYREYRYIQVLIHASAPYPEIVGRLALVETQHARIVLDKTSP